MLHQRDLMAALASCPGFTDAGDLSLPAPRPGRGPSGLLAKDALITTIGRACEAVSAARRSGRFPLLVGGDCPVILGALTALQAEQDRPGLLFVDGHEDAWPTLLLWRMPSFSPSLAADARIPLAGSWRSWLVSCASAQPRPGHRVDIPDGHLIPGACSPGQPGELELPVM